MNVDQYATLSRYLQVDEAQQLYAAGDAAHDFDHVWRVTRLAVKLAQAEGAELEIVFLAALLHDVPVIEDTLSDPATLRRSHHLAAAAYSGDFLRQRGMPPERVAAVVHCIEAHRFRDQSIQPATLEAQCLYDADKLDSMGAIGVARAFAYAGSHDTRLWCGPLEAVPPFSARPQGADYTPVHEFVYKLQKLWTTLHTPTARGLGEARHQTMIHFFELLDDEMRQIDV